MEKEQLYRIEPLKWTRSDVSEDWPRYTAQHGNYFFEKYDGQWKWGFCWDEYYDEESNYADSKAEAKKAAEAHYIGRIESYLIKEKKQ